MTFSHLRMGSAAACPGVLLTTRLQAAIRTALVAVAFLVGSHILPQRCAGQTPFLPALTVRQTQTPIFTGFRSQEDQQEITHPQSLANFRFHARYRLPSSAAKLTIRVHPEVSVSLPPGKADEWQRVDFLYEHVAGKAPSVVAEVDGGIIVDLPAIALPPPSRGERVTFVEGIPGIPTRLTIIAQGGAEMREAWIQPLSDTPHTALLSRNDDQTRERGAHLYTAFCAVCHGTSKQEGSMPTSRKLHLEPLTNGTDPYRIFQTVTKGYGQMTSLPLPVEDRYAAIQHLREKVLRPENPTQYFPVDAAYLDGLPRPMRTLTTAATPDYTRFYLDMDFGPALQGTYQLAPGNIAYKGIAIRVDPGPGGVSKGKAWMLYDHDTMRLAGAWTGNGFIDWKVISYDGSHGTHPSIVGELAWANPVGPGWADPNSGQWNDPRLPGRDGKKYGPLPREWMKYHGLHLGKEGAVLSYRVGGTEILDAPGLTTIEGAPVFKRIINLSPGTQSLSLRVAPISNTLRVALRGSGGRLVEEEGFVVLRIAPGETRRLFCIYAGNIDQPMLEALAQNDRTSIDLAMLTKGAPSRWPSTVTTLAVPGKNDGPFAVDTLTLPEPNPWNSFMRIGGFDFFADGKRAALCTWNGDVWIVAGLGPNPTTLTWRRIVTGLFQPLGLKIVRGDIFLTCRDQIAVLRDYNADGETDFIECFNNDAQVTEHFHEFAMGLQTDTAGNFYYAKSGCHALPAMVPQHGTLLRVCPTGDHTDILAHGFRAANGVCLNPDGSFFVTDQEGFWTPKNRINHVKAEGGFFGNMLGYTDVTDPSDAAMEQPLCWITNAKDRSPAELVWVPQDVWGPLGGALLNTSYGYGRLFLVPHETVGNQMQGGVIELPLPDFPAGVMRARFHPTEGQLYTAGLAVWASNCQTPGGFYRVRYQERPMYLPVAIRARAEGLSLTFTDDLDTTAAAHATNYRLKTWRLARSKNYGSKHLDEKQRVIKNARLVDKRTVLLEIEDFAPTQSYELAYELRSVEGKPFQGNIHGTVHALAKPD